MILAFVLLGVIQSSPLQLGKIEFLSPTNKSFISVHGDAESLMGEVKLDGDGLKNLKFSIPVESLKTGLGLRDHHMQERIFKTEDGKLPPVQFESKEIECKKTDATQSDCLIKGMLSIRGIPKASEFSAKLKGHHLSGSSVLKLSTWGIPQPEQLGVQVKDEVTITYEANF